jgi:quercetin dioxygenase-like cupin family protein
MKTIVRPTFITVLALTIPLARISGQSGTETVQSTNMGLHSPATVEWKSGPASLPAGAMVAALEGDPTKEGPFVMRLKVPDGYHVPAHTHPKTERVTVISGTMFLAMGDNLDRSVAKTLPTGTYGFWPAGMKHAAWFDGETVIQLHGTGPWQINYLNPADDPRNAKK